MKINVPLSSAEANSNMYGTVDQTAGRGAQQLLPSDEELEQIEKNRKAEELELAKKKVKEKEKPKADGDAEEEDEDLGGGDDSEEEEEEDDSDEDADSGDESDEGEEEDEDSEDSEEAAASAGGRSNQLTSGKRRIRRLAATAAGKGPVIISGFPGIGKSALCHLKGLVCSDSDSSQFPKDDFPNNYIAHIREIAPKNDVTLVSSHFEVRDELEEQGFDFILVYPTADQKDDYMLRYLNRGSPKAFLDLMYTNWDKFLESCAKQQGCVHVVLQPGQYLSDVIDDIVYGVAQQS
ncbi:putative AAA family ATPase [Pseudomonas phage PaBG]|uniref:Uncharacterized protein n=1 Tax=Pseudomonas phage PaBG TaxID=1335230 RepID=S5WB95_9CAUD|nr:putative AAA family ATPase [Pseudomonas phage PaBG]AGS82033.1 putative AAA family ATPase [Pseudomonas phage PaBG]